MEEFLGDLQTPRLEPKPSIREDMDSVFRDLQQMPQPTLKQFQLIKRSEKMWLNFDRISNKTVLVKIYNNIYGVFSFNLLWFFLKSLHKTYVINDKHFGIILITTRQHPNVSRIISYVYTQIIIPFYTFFLKNI